MARNRLIVHAALDSSVQSIMGATLILRSTLAAALSTKMRSFLALFTQSIPAPFPRIRWSLQVAAATKRRQEQLVASKDQEAKSFSLRVPGGEQDRGQ
jgi:hypothetical protein